MREAAARELGALEPLGRAGFAALLEAALDPDEGVAEAAATALAEVAARQPFVARLQNWSIESAAVPHALH
jgi:DNA primase